MAPKENARDNILQTAARLFQTQGYHATGLNQIIKESGSPKGSLYHYFPGGKEELAVEALNRSRDYISNRLTKEIFSSDSPETALRKLIRSFIAALESSDFTAGMSVATIALDTANTSEALRTACKQAYDEWIAIICKKLASSGMDDQLAREKAQLIHIMIEGAFIHAIVHRDTGIFNVLLSHLPTVLH